MNLPAAPPNAPLLNVIQRYTDTGSVTVLHEMFHLIGPGNLTRATLTTPRPWHHIADVSLAAEIKDQPLLEPPNGVYPDPSNVDPQDIDWLAWTSSSTKDSYGFGSSLFLGLGRPMLSLLNAENYAIFAMCLTYPVLDCIGIFANAIAKRDHVPFQPSPEAVQKIREGGSLSRFGEEKIAEE